MHIITVANQKGGTGKTTTVVTLAHGLALKGKRVWIVDVCPQGQCAVALGIEQEMGLFNLLVGGRPLDEVLRNTGREGLFLVPGDKRTAIAQTVLDSERAGIDALAQAIRPAWGQSRPDYIIIDTAPAVGGLQEMALWAADLVVVPCATDYLASDGAVRIMETMGKLSSLGWQGKLLGILPTFYDDVTRESQAMLKDLQEAFGQDQVLPQVHRATILRECVAEGKTVWEKDPDARAAREYAALVWEVLDGA